VSEKVLTFKDIDKTLLKSLPNPDKRAYEIKLKVPECTFLGVQEQPDFAMVYISFYPKNKIIELKSMKYYFYHLRNIIVSYERLINIIYDHFIEAYDPERLRIVMIYNPRGGITAMGVTLAVFCVGVLATVLGIWFVEDVGQAMEPGVESALDDEMGGPSGDRERPSGTERVEH